MSNTYKKIMNKLPICLWSVFLLIQIIALIKIFSMALKFDLLEFVILTIFSIFGFSLTIALLPGIIAIEKKQSN